MAKASNGKGKAHGPRSARLCVTRRQSPFSPALIREGSGGITVAAIDFPADLRLTATERVSGALALAPAESMDAALPHARGKLARELREGLSEFAKVELSSANLDDLTVPELHATAEALEHRKAG